MVDSLFMHLTCLDLPNKSVLPCVVRKCSLALLSRFWRFFFECVFWSFAFNVHSKCFGSSSFASWPVWLGFGTFVWVNLFFPSVGKGEVSLLFGVCVRTGYPPGIISGWVAMLERLCRSGESLCSEKSFFGSFVKVLAVFLLECVFWSCAFNMHSVFFGSWFLMSFYLSSGAARNSFESITCRPF